VRHFLVAEEPASFLPDVNCPGSYRFFNLSPEKLRQALGAHLPTIMGGMVGIKRHSRSFQNIVPAWSECTRQAECIAPPGCAIENHRFDQTALNLIIRAVEIGGQAMAVQYDPLKWLTSWDKVNLLPNHPSVLNGMNWFLRRSHPWRPYAPYIRRKHTSVGSLH
jgi:hypothetical protein